MDDRKILVLTGASRGIGHATVKRFSSAGWRVITCSRHGFPENCPWEAGPEEFKVWEEKWASKVAEFYNLS